MSTAPVQGVIVGGIHRLPIRVYFEDTDAGGIVYHARYLAYFERARSEFLRCLGIDHAAALQQSPESRLGFAVRHCQIDYLAPAVLDDTLRIESQLARVGAAYTDVRQRVLRGDMVLVQASLRIAMVDGRGRPARLPRPWREAMVPLVGKEEW